MAEIKRLKDLNIEHIKGTLYDGSQVYREIEIKQNTIEYFKKQMAYETKKMKS